MLCTSPSQLCTSAQCRASADHHLPSATYYSAPHGTQLSPDLELVWQLLENGAYCSAVKKGKVYTLLYSLEFVR